MNHFTRWPFAACILSLAPYVSAAEPPVITPVTVRVQAHDAKFIGSGVGEMNIRVEDAETGAVLASGRLSGGTGDTERLVKTPISRGAVLADEKSASYVANLSITQPTRIRIFATGPLKPSYAAQEISVTTWVVPGRPIGGDGIVLKLPGLIVSPVQAPAQGRQIPLVADVQLMCGCPIDRTGLWKASDYEVKALVEHENAPAQEAALDFTGQTNRFAGSMTVSASGRYRIILWAHNAKTGNTGAARYTVDVP
jgi:hypothetical protein